MRLNYEWLWVPDDCGKCTTVKFVLVTLLTFVGVSISMSLYCEDFYAYPTKDMLQGLSLESVETKDTLVYQSDNSRNASRKVEFHRTDHNTDDMLGVAFTGSTKEYASNNKTEYRCSGTNVCHRHATCTPKNKKCLCDPGYVGDGVWCGKIYSERHLTGLPHRPSLNHVPGNASSESNENQHYIDAPSVPTIVVSSMDSSHIDCGMDQRNNSKIAFVLYNLQFGINDDKSTRRTIDTLRLYGALITVEGNTARSEIDTSFMDITLRQESSKHRNLTTPLPSSRVTSVHDVWQALADDAFESQWFILLDFRHENMDMFWKSWSSTFTHKPLGDALNTVASGISCLNFNVPILFGQTKYDDTILVHRGDGFAQIEARSWLPMCTPSQLVVSRGFIFMYKYRGLIGTDRDVAHKGFAEFSECISANTDHPEIGSHGASTEIVSVATCLYEEFGFKCQSLGSIVNSEEPEDEWEIQQRHVSWNCSLETNRADAHNQCNKKNKNSSCGLVDAVCQAPLKYTQQSGSKPDRMMSAPVDIGEMYALSIAPSVVKHGTSEKYRDNHAPTATTSIKRTNAWMFDAILNVTVRFKEPVLYTKNEVRDVVFGVGAGEHVDVPRVDLFVRSLRTTGCRAEIVLFIDSRCISNFLYMEKMYGGMRIFAFDEAKLSDRYKRQKAVVIYRFVLYEHFLQTADHAKLYRRCLHADLFDTIFQSDPFDAVDSRGGLAVFAENPKVEIAHCRYHRYWYHQCHERTMLHDHHSLPRVCMGVVLGDKEAFLLFLRMTLYRMLQWCNDQGVLNMLVWSGQFAEIMNVTIYTAKKGPVFHANTEWDFEFFNESLVTSVSGHAYSVVHQWDRLMKLHPLGNTLTNSVRSLPKRRESLKRFYSNPKFAWNNEELIPQCRVLEPPSQDIVCVVGTSTRHGSKHSLFCPTHTKMTHVADKIQ